MCLPKCYCGVERVYNLNSESDGYEFERMYCDPEDASESGDGCLDAYLDNEDAHNQCGDELENCESGEYCYAIPDADLGVGLELKAGTIEIT